MSKEQLQIEIDLLDKELICLAAAAVQIDRIPHDRSAFKIGHVTYWGCLLLTRIDSVIEEYQVELKRLRKLLKKTNDSAA